jgi:hypothetical protein
MQSLRPGPGLPVPSDLRQACSTLGLPVVEGVISWGLLRGKASTGQH